MSVRAAPAMGKPAAIPARGLYINGHWQQHSGKRLDVVNPYDGSVIGQVPAGSKPDIDLAVQAAVEAYPSWSKTTGAERAGLLRKLAQGVRHTPGHIRVCCDRSQQGL